jgi:hypothetical protein
LVGKLPSVAETYLTKDEKLKKEGNAHKQEHEQVADDHR